VILTVFFNFYSLTRLTFFIVFISCCNKSFNILFDFHILLKKSSHASSSLHHVQKNREAQIKFNYFIFHVNT
jgi:hypothetical protein